MCLMSACSWTGRHLTLRRQASGRCRIFKTNAEIAWSVSHAECWTRVLKATENGCQKSVSINRANLVKQKRGIPDQPLSGTVASEETNHQPGTELKWRIINDMLCNESPVLSLQRQGQTTLYSDTVSAVKTKASNHWDIWQSALWVLTDTGKIDSLAPLSVGGSTDPTLKEQSQPSRMTDVTPYDCWM